MTSVRVAEGGSQGSDFDTINISIQQLTQISLEEEGFAFAGEDFSSAKTTKNCGGN